MDKKIINIFYLIIVISVLFLYYVNTSFTYQDTVINSENTHDYSDGWSYKVVENDSVYGTTSLPAFLPVQKNEHIIIENTLPQYFLEGMTFAFRSSQQFVKISIDNQPFYEYKFLEKQPFGKSPGSAWHLVRIPTSQEGKLISIEFNSPYASYAGKINSMMFGSKNSCVFHIISHSFVPAITCITVALCGIALIIIYNFIKKQTNDKSLLYLGLFSVFASIWSFGETSLYQLFWGNIFLITLVSLTSMFLMPIPFILFISSSCRLNHNKIIKFLCYLNCTNLLIALFLQITNVYDLIETLPLAHGTVILSAIILFILILKQYAKEKNHLTKNIIIGFLVFLVFIFFDMHNFYVLKKNDTSFYFRIGLVFFISILGISSSKCLFSIISANIKVKALEEIAFIDILTKAKNRASFEMDFEKYRTNPSLCENLAIAIFDINNLKLVNDTLGHAAGDDLIIRAHDCIFATFGEYSKCYRIGGDEFLVLTTSLDEVTMQKLCISFEENSMLFSENSPSPLVVAYGYAFYDSSIDNDANSLFSRADANMYEKKACLKKLYYGRRREDNVTD